MGSSQACAQMGSGACPWKSTVTLFHSVSLNVGKPVTCKHWEDRMRGVQEAGDLGPTRTKRKSS